MSYTDHINALPRPEPSALRTFAVTVVNNREPESGGTEIVVEAATLQGAQSLACRMAFARFGWNSCTAFPPQDVSEVLDEIVP